MSPDTHIIDMSAEDLQDLNDALADEWLEIEFGLGDSLGFYRLTGGSGGSCNRTRISQFTKASECWEIARKLFPEKDDK